ncbi:MAG: glycosyltransferase family 2 protein [Egibacteraceae bacterium]
MRAPTGWREVVPRAKMPVIVICHNLVADLRSLVGWLERTGHQRLVLLDNASTYPPLLDYFRTTPHEVVRLRENLGHQAPWLSGLLDRLGHSCPYVVTDPDVLPDESCPPDAVEYFQSLLLRHRDFDKAGFGLRLDDIPECYPHRWDVVRWEQPFWDKPIAAGVFAAHIDTTFAVCRPGTPYKVTEALRTGAPYCARHMPWYRDPREPDAETAYFFEHRRSDVGYWSHNDLPPAARGKLAEDRHGG